MNTKIFLKLIEFYISALTVEKIIINTAI